MITRGFLWSKIGIPCCKYIYIKGFKYFLSFFYSGLGVRPAQNKKFILLRAAPYFHLKNGNFHYLLMKIGGPQNTEIERAVSLHITLLKEKYGNLFLYKDRLFIYFLRGRFCLFVLLILYCMKAVHIKKGEFLFLYEPYESSS